MASGKRAIVIGAGPAGLTAAYELLTNTDIKPVIYEMTDSVGGIARTVEYKGNRIDIGGHRLFSKSDRVTQWWLKFLPLQGAPSIDQIMLKKKAILSGEKDAPDPEKTDKVMLARNRISRIFFSRKFFNYPLSEHFETFLKLGLSRSAGIIFSYIRAHLFPIKDEKNLEDFFINRFGRVLYVIFFKNYTKKVWGVSCREIPAEWGYQRINRLNIFKLVCASFKNLLFKTDSLYRDPGKETSLIETFMYPKLGVGQLWEEVAKAVIQKGGEIRFHHKIIELRSAGNRITEVLAQDTLTGNTTVEQADYFFSTMPVRDLVKSMGDITPPEVREVAGGLRYRDFITIGLLLGKMSIKNRTGVKTINDIIPDNWIYIQERDVRLGRLQIYNNWSPYMVKDKSNIWLGLEYFCNEGDTIWNMPDDKLLKYGISELIKLGFVGINDVLDGTVIRTRKTYPAYYGAYQRFNVIRDFMDKFENLFLIGRNGMHRYNNMDHSMLTAMVAVDNIVKGVRSKDSIWSAHIE